MFPQVGKGANELKAQTDRAYLGFLSMKRAKEFCYLPPGRNASPSQGYPLAGTHLYTWVKRDKMEESSSSK